MWITKGRCHPFGARPSLPRKEVSTIRVSGWVKEAFTFRFARSHPLTRAVLTSSLLILRRDLILLQLSIRHFECPRTYHSLRKSHDVNAQSHAAAQSLGRLHE